VTFTLADLFEQSTVPDATVVTFDATGKSVGSPATTDAAGVATVRFSSAGPVTLVAVARGYGAAIATLDPRQLLDGQGVVMTVPKLLVALTSVVADPSQGPGHADVTKELGIGTIATTPPAGGAATMFYLQGPKVSDPDHDLRVPLTGSPETSYQWEILDPMTLRPVAGMPAPLSLTTDANGVAMVDPGAALDIMAAQGAMFVVFTPPPSAAGSSQASAPPLAAHASQGTIRPENVTVAIPGGGTMSVGNIPGACGPASARCVERALPTGFVTNACPTAASANTCSVTLSVSVTATLEIQPFGVGVAVSATAGISLSGQAGANSLSVPGKYQCDLKFDVCGWSVPGSWVAQTGWSLCGGITYGIPYAYPCRQTSWVWVESPSGCSGGGGAVVQTPNLQSVGGQCVCFNWSVDLDKYDDCPNAAACGQGKTLDGLHATCEEAELTDAGEDADGATEASVGDAGPSVDPDDGGTDGLDAAAPSSDDDGDAATTSCANAGDTCEEQEDCCSGVCTDGVCGGGDCGVDGGSGAAAGAPCEADDECCSGSCDLSDGTCNASP
jgi:hypothetical protein